MVRGNETVPFTYLSIDQKWKHILPPNFGCSSFIKFTHLHRSIFFSRSAVSAVRVTPCSTDSGQKLVCAGIVVKSISLKAKTNWFPPKNAYWREFRAAISNCGFLNNLGEMKNCLLFFASQIFHTFLNFQKRIFLLNQSDVIFRIIFALLTKIGPKNCYRTTHLQNLHFDTFWPHGLG